jgi:TonB-dependent SusC/RagA subfamily outer membrane receptor
MDKIIVYLLEVTAGSVLMYLSFVLFFRNDTFYQRNRILLLLVILLPLVFPLISIGTRVTSSTASPVIILVDRFAAAGGDIQSSVAARIKLLDATTVIAGIWLAGFSILILRTIISLARTVSIIINGEKVIGGKVKIIVSDLSHPPFSFWPYAVIPRNIYDTPGIGDIIKHEEFHIRQMHTIDLIMSELFTAIFWFNPVTWFLKRSIVLNHEYLADNKTILETSSIMEYQYRLVNLATGINKVHLIHNFNSNIKNRITMINKNSSSRFAALKTIFIVPAILISLLFFSFKSFPGTQEKKDNQTMFSAESQKKILEMIYTNIKYPSEAKAQNVTGRFFVIVKMKKGGIVDQVKINDSDQSINVPLLTYSEVVITGYGLKGSDDIQVVGYGSQKSGESPENYGNKKGFSLLTDEGIRVANMLGSVKIPEWENKGLEFAISFNFTLKYSGLQSNTIQIRENGSFKGSTGNVLFIIDGKEANKEQIDKLDPNQIESMTVLKGESAAALYGSKGMDGVIVIKTKN